MLPRLTVLAAFSLLSQFALPLDGPLTFKGIPLGSPPSTLTARFPSVKCMPVSDGLPDDYTCLVIPEVSCSRIHLNENCTPRDQRRGRCEPYPIAKEQLLSKCREYDELMAFATTRIKFMRFDYFNNRLMLVDLSFGSIGFRGAVLGLNEKFGPPTDTETITKRNRLGNTFPSQRFTWRFEDGQIVADEMVTKVDEGAVRFQFVDYLVEALKRFEKKQKSSSGNF